jgi:hypothetical protein
VFFIKSDAFVKSYRSAGFIRKLKKNLEERKLLFTKAIATGLRDSDHMDKDRMGFAVAVVVVVLLGLTVVIVVMAAFAVAAVVVGVAAGMAIGTVVAFAVAVENS